jgi:serralysin
VLNGDASLDQTSGFENLIGSGLNDVLTGDGSANVINGGLGNDSLTGGLGADSFIFNTALNATTNNDTIIDFVHGVDKIHLDNAIFTALGLATGGLTDAQFRLSPSELASATDRIIYDAAAHTLTYDSNGGLVAGGTTVFATLTGAPTLTFADFLII